MNVCVSERKCPWQSKSTEKPEQHSETFVGVGDVTTPQQVDDKVGAADATAVLDVHDDVPTAVDALLSVDDDASTAADALLGVDDDASTAAVWSQRACDDAPSAAQDIDNSA